MASDEALHDTLLLTGASGFLGSHIADRLAREDVTLRLMLRRTSSLRFLEDAAGKYERVEGDLRNEASMAAALKDVDCVIACGGITWARTEAEYQAVNAIGTQRLVTASVAAASSVSSTSLAWRPRARALTASPCRRSRRIPSQPTGAPSATARRRCLLQKAPCRSPSCARRSSTARATKHSRPSTAPSASCVSCPCTAMA